MPTGPVMVLGWFLFHEEGRAHDVSEFYLDSLNCSLGRGGGVLQGRSF